MPEIGLFEAIYSARAIRRLKPDPVPEELVSAVLDAAIRAPSGGNAQNWAFIVVRDVELRKQIGAIYRKASDIAEAIYAARGRPAHMSDSQFARLMSSGKYLWDHIGEAPILLIPCARRPILPPREALPPEIAAHWRFADILADACARLGADVGCYSFTVVDLHHLLSAGFPAHQKSSRLCEPTILAHTFFAPWMSFARALNERMELSS